MRKSRQTTTEFMIRVGSVSFVQAFGGTKAIATVQWSLLVAA